MPDISGFTEFVSEVEISHSEHIIAELLELLINGNQLGLELCEIEGDALFFYRFGDPPPLEEMLAQVRRWVVEFHAHLKLLKRDVYCSCGSCQNVGRLSLKAVGHFGEFSVYTVKNKTKIIGKDVIVIHRLLKNSIGDEEYLLLTDSLLKTQGAAPDGAGEFQPHRETYPVIGEVSGAVMNLAPVSAAVPDPPAVAPLTRLENEIYHEGEISAPFEKVVQKIGNPNTWPEWIEGLSHLKIDRSEPIKPGHHHICVFPDADLSITMEQIVEQKNDFILVEDLGPPPPLKTLKLIHRVERRGERTYYRASFTYTKKPILGRRFDKKIAPMLQGQLLANLNNLKGLLE